MIRKNGFTLLEMVVVIGILAIMAVFLIAILNPLQQFEKARDSQRKSDLNQIQKALEQYYQDHGKYPASSTTNTIEDINNNPISWGSSWSPYMNVVPTDPNNNRTYVYFSSSADSYQTYYLYTSLEKGPSDPQTCMTSSSLCQSNPNDPTDCNCTNVSKTGAANCGVNGSTYPCNYGVTSPNTQP